MRSYPCRCASRPNVLAGAMLALLLALPAPQPSHAQPARLRFTHVTPQEGLPHSQVRDVLQDRQGFMWFATAGGLARFDGYQVTVYTYDPDDAGSLSDNDVWALCEDREGRLWVGTQGGLNRFDPATRSFTRYANDPADPGSLPHTAVRALVEDRQGRLWVGTYGSGIGRYEPETDSFTRFRFAPDATEAAGYGINGLYEAPSEPGVLWVTSWGGGLGRFDTRTGAFSYFAHHPADPRSLGNNRSLSVLEDRQGRLWVGSEGGLQQLDRRTGTFTTYRYDPGEPIIAGYDIVWDLLLPAGDPGGLWMATNGGGLTRLDLATGAFTYHRHDPHDPYSLGSDEVMALYEDATGVLWAGTLGGGVSRTDRRPSPFRHITHQPGRPNSLGHPSVRGLIEAADGVVWVGLESGGIDRFDPRTGTFTHYRHAPRNPKSLANDQVAVLHQDGRGALWVGLWYNGVDRFDPATETFTHLPPPHGQSWGEPWKLYEDRQGLLWIGLVNNGLFRFDPRDGSAVYYSDSPDSPARLSHNRVFALLEDRQGALWIGTGGGGLDRLDVRTGAVAVYRHDPADPASLSSNSVTALARDLHGGLWVGTGGGGLNHFDPEAGTFTRFTTQNSDLPNNNVGCLLVDRRGHVWIGTDAGLTHFDPEQRRFTTFTEEDGFERQELRVAFAGPSGTFYFGGREGFDAFVPEQLPVVPNPSPPPVALTALHVGGALVPLRPEAPPDPLAWRAEAVALAATQRDVAFTFAALHYVNPSRNQYRYRLDGYDDDWHGPGAERTATYTNLDPGTYTFRVQAASSDGVWNEQGASITVTVAPFFYETRWFAALCAVAAGLLLFAGYRYRTRQLRRREHVLAAQVAERTQALQAEKEKTEEQARRLVEMDRAKSRFFTNVSHEFRTPLTLTIGPLEDLQADLQAVGQAEGASLPARERVDLALRNSRRLLRLINQLLDVAKLEAGEMRLKARRQDLAAFVRALALSFAPLAERRRIRFDVEAPEAPLPVYFDADKLEQVFVNLLSNAFKFTPEGGAIRLEVHAASGAIAVSVRDSGPGIPAADLPHVFDRFYQVDETYAAHQHGSGIGLSLAKDLAALHGGTLAVESTAGFGATFTVTLPLGRAHLRDDQVAADDAPVGERPAPAPLLPDAAEPPSSLADDEAPESEDRTTVLVVDDNADIRAYVRRHLEPRYRLLEAADGRAALDTARHALPDLVVSDVMMPGLDGFALVRALKADRETDFIPVILLTARAGDADRIEGLQEGADDYLTKPFNVRELQARVDNLIASRRRLRERFAALPPAEHAPGPAGDGLSAADARFLERVRAAVEAHLGEEDFSVEDLAAAVDQSRSNLHRRLRLLLGVSPSTFIRNCRLETAAALLAEQRGTVSEVAYAVGFKSIAHFSTSFSSVFGVSPSRYADRQVHGPVPTG